MRPGLPVLLGITMLVLAALSTSIGYAPLDMRQAIGDSLAGRDSMEALVLLQLRVPRALLGIMVGFSLGVSGAAMQGLLRNPLADPGVLGVSAAAALGAVITFYAGFSLIFPLALPLGGIGGAMIATFLVQFMAGRGTGTMSLVLAGVAMSTLCGALTALALNLSPNPYAALEIIFWLMGSLADRGMDHVALIIVPMLAGWAVLLTLRKPLDALTLGEDTAHSLGYPVSSARSRALLGSGLAVGSAVAVSGAIGFVGLVVPHLLRPLVGHRPGNLLLVSGLGGACLVLAADMLVRLLPFEPELQLGVVTALVGAPFLLSLIWRARRRP